MVVGLLEMSLEMAVELAMRSRKEMSMARDARIPELWVFLPEVEEEP
jgi:hypothetical protein